MSSSVGLLTFSPHSFLQIKRKLPKVNRVLAARILEDEEAENETKDADGDDIKKKSKKKKALSSDVFKDERFTAMFENKVIINLIILEVLTNCLYWKLAHFQYFYL